MGATARRLALTLRAYSSPKCRYKKMGFAEWQQAMEETNFNLTFQGI